MKGSVLTRACMEARFAATGVDGVGVIAKGRGRKSWLPEGTVAEVVRVTLEETPDDTSTHCGLCLKRPCDFRIALAAPDHRERHRPRRHRAVSMLLSPESGWITGQRIEVSGGMGL